MPAAISVSPSPRAIRRSSGSSGRARTSDLVSSRRRDPRRPPYDAGARLLRGHRFLRCRLSRQLLRFMERGRTNYLRLLGVDHGELWAEAQSEAPGFAFVVRSMQIEFLKPARMDDVLTVVTAPEEVKGASITLNQRILRGDDLLVEAHVRVALVCEGRAKPIPKALRIAMKAQQDQIGG